MVGFPSVLPMLCGNTKNEVKVPDLAATSQVKDLTGCQTFIEHTQLVSWNLDFVFK